MFKVCFSFWCLIISCNRWSVDSGAREYHVQFFGTVPERAWIHEKRVAAYKGRSQYEALVAETARQASNAAEKQKVSIV